jgi:hypothetical protein
MTRHMASHTAIPDAQGLETQTIDSVKFFIKNHLQDFWQDKLIPRSPACKMFHAEHGSFPRPATQAGPARSSPERGRH